MCIRDRISELEDHLNLQLGWQNVSCIDQITQVELTWRERLGNYQKIVAREMNQPKKGELDCPHPMTAKEWRSVLEAEDGPLEDDEAEDGLLEGEEEEIFEADEEEEEEQCEMDDLEGEEISGEPEAKKSKIVHG